MTTQPRRIFLDIGGHLGQTLDEVLSGCYAFDLVHTFEPMPDFASRLETVYAKHVHDGRLQVHACGLSNRNAVVPLFGDNAGGGATICPGKQPADQVAPSVLVQLVRATEFFDKHLRDTDQVIVKLNCEGAEGDILTDLIESGRIHGIDDVMVDFDLFKVKGRRHEPFEIVRRLQAVGFDNYHLAIDVMVGCSHRERIRNWLAHVNQRIPIARVPQVFDGLPRPPRAIKRALRAIKCRTLGLIDASPLNRAG